MKRFLILVLTALLLCSLSACENAGKADYCGTEPGQCCKGTDAGHSHDHDAAKSTAKTCCSDDPSTCCGSAKK
jgi:hypothetical protein